MSSPHPFFTPAAPMHRFARMHDGVPAQMRVVEPAPLDPPPVQILEPVGQEPDYLAERLDEGLFEDQ